MANMRLIRTRIKSVKNTQQITKAMKMVAASKLRRTQTAMNSARPFYEKSREVLDALLSGGSAADPLTTPREDVKKVLYVLFVGNRGLCGVYNNAVLHFARELIKNDERECELLVCGRWGRDVIMKSGLSVREIMSELSDTPGPDEATALAEKLRELFLSGEYDEVRLVYQHYISALRQEPTQLQLLPLVPEKTGDAAPREYIFEPDRQSVLGSLLRLCVNSTVYSVMLEARCGEHTARMTAMTAATDSTRELIDKLGLSLNRARQAAITTEISEIVGGASALRKKKQ